MRLLNVLVTVKLDEECLHQIADLSPELRVTDVSGLIKAECKGDFSSKDKLDVFLAKADIIYGFTFPKNLVARTPRLKWIQSTSAGVEHILSHDLVQSPVQVTSVSGIHAIPIGEFVITLMLMLAKQAPLCFELKKSRQWKEFPPAVLHSKTVGIVGLGSIGGEIARLSKAFSMKVIAIRRSTKKLASARNVDVLLPLEGLNQLLTQSDFIILSLPLTNETHGLIGEKQLKIMKSSAYLINVSRGAIIDEQALIEALENNQIAGAGLDVFATEPLPAESKLWRLKNVIITSHISGVMTDYLTKTTIVFCENLRRYLAGQKLLNIVDKKAGY
jgi:phosphoglycerate dehydrogenase-like enzyme